MPEIRSVADVVRARHSVRAFLPTPVPHDEVADLLALAARTASNSNTQPWAVHVLTGAARGRISAVVGEAADAGEDGLGDEQRYQPAPDAWPDPLSGRRRAFGAALFGDVLGIAHDDHAARYARHRRNFDFWGAPVGMILTTDAGAFASGFVDAGGFLTTLMLLATDRGLATCAQAAFTEYTAILRRELELPQQHRVVCGVALGHEDRSDPAEEYHSDRVPLAEFVTYHDS